MDESSSAWDYRSLLPSRAVGDGSDDSLNESSSSCHCCGYELPPLTWRERAIGCATCMIGGYILSLGSFFRLWSLIFHGNPYPLVVNATLGNLIALAGSGFYAGPAAQRAKMWQPARRTATLAYISSLGGTLLLLLLRPAVPLLLLALLVQYGAVTWYCLSYIPYAHETIRAVVWSYWNAARGSGDIGM